VTFILTVPRVRNWQAWYFFMGIKIRLVSISVQVLVKYKSDH